MPADTDFNYNDDRSRAECSVNQIIMGKYIVYILRTSSNTLYVGQTNDLEKRIKEHKSKTSKSAKYMRYFKSFELVFSEKHNSRTEAMKREYQLKRFTKTQKEALVSGKMKN